MKNLTKTKTYKLTQKEKEIKNLVTNDVTTVGLIDGLLDIPQRKVTIYEFILEYGNCINDCKHFEENIEHISFQHSYGGESIDSIVKKYFNTNAISNSQLSDLKTSLYRIISSYDQRQL